MGTSAGCPGKTIDKVIHSPESNVSAPGNRLRIARVALDRPVDHLFDYLNAGADVGDIGRRVQVPFGSGSSTGILVDLTEDSAVQATRLRPIGTIDRSLEPMAADVIATLRFAAGYYQHPFGAALFAALPPAGPARPAPVSIRRPRRKSRSRHPRPSASSSART